MTRTLDTNRITFINHHTTNHRVDFFGIPVVDRAFHDFLHDVEQHIVRRESTHIVNLNPHHFLMTRNDEEFAGICSSGDIVFTDGVGIVLASVLEKNSIRNRFTGLDLMVELCALSSERGYSVFFLGGQGGIAHQCATNLRNQFPSLQIAGVYEMPFEQDVDQYENEAILRTVNSAKPDILFVALGAPKQEKWIERNRRALEVPILMGVGGSFDIVGGRLPRAPVWMRRIGLEWLFRLSLEPRRLASRYLIGIPRYILLVLRLRLRTRKSLRSP